MGDTESLYLETVDATEVWLDVIMDLRDELNDMSLEANKLRNLVTVMERDILYYQNRIAELETELGWEE